MSNKYILNPDGTVLKYVEIKDAGVKEALLTEFPEENSDDNKKISDSEIGDILLLSANEDSPSKEINPPEIYDAVKGGSINLGTIGSFDRYDSDKIVKDLPRINSFGFKRDNQGNLPGKDIKSFKTFNSYIDTREDASNPKVFADEFEMLGGVRRDPSLSNGGDLTKSMFTYFAEVVAQIAFVEAIVFINRGFTSANGQQNRTAERFNLRVGKYDYTEYDLFTRYIYNVLNYPHDNSNLLERTTAFFVGFAEWMSPDSFIDFDEIIKDTTTDMNDLDFISALSTVGDNRSIIVFASELAIVAYAAIKIVVSGASNQTVQNRANLLFRKFYQERYWEDKTLYNAKEKESSILDFFTDLNYYYTKFFIERIQIGLKLISKYVYDDSYLRGREKDSPQSRVSALRSNRHIDYGIKIFADANGKAFSQDIFDYFNDPEYKKLEEEDDAASEAIKAAANSLLKSIGVKLPDSDSAPKEADAKYNWQQKHSDGDFDSKITQNKKPGQTTRIRALPQLFSLHPALKRALAANGKKSFSLGKDLTQNFYKIHEKERRIPEYAVKEIEAVLEAEYMPFYFHDIRTNEIISFHAFIENISDSFNPEYNSSSGFGRIDDVRTYVKTTRNVNVSFTLAATSEADHDLMWYQVNKIVAMVYPQWSGGLDASDGDFKYPFTQVPTASPLIRLRVGDVIKSNYSRTNLSRLHGIGESKGEDKDNKLKFDGNEKKYELMPGLYRTDNGAEGVLDIAPNGSLAGIAGAPRSISIDHPVKIHKLYDNVGDFYVVEIDNTAYKELSTADLLKLPPDIPVSKKIRVVADASKIMIKQNSNAAGNNIASDLMAPTKDGKSNNPITKSYESGMSKGLAGFITQLDVNYNEVNWETSRIGSKAPMLVKLTINFAPIHDIPPGLDHNGMLRAPVYNVGRINNEFFGDPADFSYTGSGKDFAMAKYRLLDHLNKKKYKDPS